MSSAFLIAYYSPLYQSIVISIWLSSPTYPYHPCYILDIYSDIGDDIIMPYYKRLRELREDHDLSQRKLAAILNLTQPQYFRYEQGYRYLPTDILIRLANLYDTSTDYILGRTDDPRNISSEISAVGS